jgi:NAD(P)-dependent dehydrogenase (short-subunit alcohol dehydrogenase family)
MSEMQGKTVLITGANQGLGKASALALARMGANLVLVSRSAEKAKSAIAEIERAVAEGPSRRTRPTIDLLVGDLASQADIRRIAAEFKAKHDRLDVLLNNAGVLVTTRRTTVDGIEETFAVNHLGYFLLTSLLLDVLKQTAAKTGGARIVNVASEAHRTGRVNWEDLQFERTRYRPFTAYSQSKLLNILFTRELARRLAGTKVTVNAVHPGVIASGFGQTYGGLISALVKVAHPFMLSPEKGADTQVWLASTPEVAGQTGLYFQKRAAKTPNRAAQDDAAARKLWEISLDLTGLRTASHDAAA